METQRFEGIWWTPNEDSKKIAGTLIASDENLRLSLIGSFTDIRGVMKDERYPIILGLAKGSKVLTLVDCVQTSANLGMPGFPSKEFAPRAVLVGGHVGREEALSFPKASVQYSCLSDWVGASGFDREIDTEDGQLKRVHLRYEYPEETKLAIPGGELAISFGFQTGGDLLNDATLRQDVHVRIEVEESLDLEHWFSRYIGPLQNFLTLATGRPNAVTSVKVYSPELVVSTSQGDRMSPLELLFTPVFTSTREVKRLFLHEMLFTLDDIRDHAEDVLNRWLQVAEKLDSVCNLFLSLQYRAPTYLEHRFLPLIQATESYHRRRMKNQELELEAHIGRVQSVVERSPVEHREWLQGKLLHSNEPSLRRRLKDLWVATEEVLSPLLPNKEQFISKVVDTRNYLTHHDPDLRDSAANGEELFYLTEAISFLLEACLLGELGISREKIGELFRRNQRYASAVNRVGRDNQ